MVLLGLDVSGLLVPFGCLSIFFFSLYSQLVAIPSRGALPIEICSLQLLKQITVLSFDLDPFLGKTDRLHHSPLVSIFF